MSSKPQVLPLAAWAHGSPSGPCKVCGKAGAKACSRCLVDCYCSKDHQVKDWPRHKQGCGAVELRVDAALGRYLVATKDIPAGTAIMRELPLVAWPNPRFSIEGVQTVCVACCNPLRSHDARPCGRCGWAVCGDACSRKPAHRADCEQLQHIPCVHEPYVLGTHLNSLATSRVREASMTVPLLRAWHAEMKEGFDKKKDFWVDQEELEDLWGGTLGQMGFESRGRRQELLRKGSKDYRLFRMVIQRYSIVVSPHETVCALFSGASLLEHACVPNTGQYTMLADLKSTVEPPPGGDPAKMEVVTVTLRAVERGERLSRAFAWQQGWQPFMGAPARRKALRNVFSFRCACALCTDPTEGGLRLSAWYCSVCKGRGRQLLVLVDADGTLRRCEGCGQVDEEGRKQTNDLNARFQALQDRAAGGETVQAGLFASLLERALWPRGPLHPTSQLALQAKLEILKRMFELMQNPFGGSIGRLAGYCRDLMAAANSLCPGHIELLRAPAKTLASLLTLRMTVPEPPYDPTTQARNMEVRDRPHAHQAGTGGAAAHPQAVRHPTCRQGDPRGGGENPQYASPYCKTYFPVKESLRHSFFAEILCGSLLFLNCVCVICNQ